MVLEANTECKFLNCGSLLSKRKREPKTNKQARNTSTNKHKSILDIKINIRNQNHMKSRRASDAYLLTRLKLNFHKLVPSFFKINTGHNSQIYCSSKIHKIRLCSIPYLQIVMEAKECSYL